MAPGYMSELSGLFLTWSWIKIDGRSMLDYGWQSLGVLHYVAHDQNTETRSFHTENNGGRERLIALQMSCFLAKIEQLHMTELSSLMRERQDLVDGFGMGEDLTCLIRVRSTDNQTYSFL